MDNVSTIISFDIGMVNLAFCVAKTTHMNDSKITRVQDWKLYDLNTKNAEKANAVCIALLKKAFATLPDTNNVWVLIERQMPVNTQCMCISHAIFAFFMTFFDNLNVSFVDSISKPLKEKKRKRKQESVALTLQYLQNDSECLTCREWLEWFQNQRKKDDLADAFMQILGNLCHINLDRTKVQSEVIVIDSD
jgi:hypothetical protein